MLPNRNASPSSLPLVFASPNEVLKFLALEPVARPDFLVIEIKSRERFGNGKRKIPIADLMLKACQACYRRHKHEGVGVADFAFFKPMKLHPNRMLSSMVNQQERFLPSRARVLCIQVADFVNGFDAIGEGDAQGKQEVLDLLNQQIRRAIAGEIGVFQEPQRRFSDIVGFESAFPCARSGGICLARPFSGWSSFSFSSKRLSKSRMAKATGLVFLKILKASCSPMSLKLGSVPVDVSSKSWSSFAFSKMALPEVKMGL